MNDLSRITERYNLDKLIHAGDAASVFRATDLRSGEPVALKLLRGSARFSEPQRRERFESAARALGECRHRCLPSLLDFGVTAGGSAFLVTEYLPGVTLDLLTGSPAERVLPLLIPVLGALEELDRHQLAHRGLRADNLLVVPRGEPGGDELPAEGANDANDADGEQVKVLGWGSATWGAGEEGRRADLGAFAELTCTVLGARVERTPAAVVTLPAAAGTRIADAAELAILLSLLLQPGGPLPASLYAELRRAFRQALHGGADPEATQPRLLADVVTAPSGAAASRRRPAGPRPATRQLADLDDLDDLEQETRALRGDITMAVPRERLPRAPQGRPPTAALGAGAAQPSAAETSARGDAAQVRSPLTAAGIRMETMPSFLASDLGGSPTGFPPPTAGSAANANAAELDIEPAAGTGQDAAPGSTAPEWTATRLIAPPAAADRSAPARATSGAILPFPSVQAAAGPAPAAATGAAAAVPAAASLPGAAPAPTAPMMIPATPTPALPAATAATTAAVPRAPAPPPPTAAPGAGPALDRPDVPATADRPGGTGGSWRAVRRTRLLLYGAAAALLVLAAVAGPPLVRHIVAGYPGSRRAPSAPVPAGAAAGRPAGGVKVPPAAELPAAAPQPLDPRLAAAQALLAGGDPGGARRVLAEIPAGEAAGLAPADRADFERLTAALAADRRARRTQIAADLAAGFRRSDVRRLGAALSGARREPDLPPAIRQDLDRARQAVELDARLAQSDQSDQSDQSGQGGAVNRAAQQSPGDVLHTATLLLAILPRHARALALRDQAARAVEAQADEALAAGDAGRAAALASSLRQDWPDRPGLQERATRIESQRRGDEHLEDPRRSRPRRGRQPAAGRASTPWPRRHPPPATASASASSARSSTSCSPGSTPRRRRSPCGRAGRPSTTKARPSSSRCASPTTWR